MENAKNEVLGNIKISEDVIITCAATATLKTVGIYSLAETFAGNLTRGIWGKDFTNRGIKVVKDDGGYTLDIYVVVEYAVRIPEVAWELQENIKKEIEGITGEKVHAINIHVQDVHFPDGEGETND